MAMAMKQSDIQRGQRGHISGTTENKGEGEKQMASKIQYFIEIVNYRPPHRPLQRGRPPRTIEEMARNDGIAVDFGWDRAAYERDGSLFLQPVYGIGPFETRAQALEAREPLLKERDDIGRVLRGVHIKDLISGRCVFRCYSLKRPLRKRQYLYPKGYGRETNS